ncbi:leucine-rich repeat domain-containing protein, partial [Chryseobacterium luteum]|uniref:leucine-rich repeat domain-containing protein n=1 Tax=Chryseobacterium luteum TaxID=421531 RepID=UPI00068B3344
MKKKLFLLFLLLSLAANAQIINIPDANFKAYLLSSSSSNTIAKNFGGNYFAIDANGDGEIQQSEADQVEGLEIDDTSPGPIENYEGISSFSNVKSIGINSFVAPTTPLTISNLNFLENLFVNFHDILGSIDIVNNPQLKNIMISGITLNTLSNNPLIENLIIYSESGSSISANAMGGIEGLSNLKNLELNGFYNMISSLPINLSGHNNLLSLKIFHTSLDNVDVSGCSVLHDITLDSSYLNLTAAININSSNCPNLTNYSVAQNGNVSANIISDNCPGLINFISTDYGEVSLSLNGCTNLELINVRNLGSLSVNNCINLNKIKALRFRGSSLDLSNNNLQNLKYIEIDFNPINGSGPGPLTFLNVQGITSLLELRCFYHQISNLNVQGCTQLKYLDCSQNQLAALNVQGLNNLERLECSENQLNSLDVHNLASLKWLNSYACGLVTLNAQNCPNLEYLHCAENQLTSLNVQGCNNLETLACLHNQLTSLDVSGLSKLQLLSCGFNQLTSLDLRDCINLQEFWCDNNQLTTLFMKNGSNEPLGFGFSNNPALQYICCDDTQMNEV